MSFTPLPDNSVLNINKALDEIHKALGDSQYPVSQPSVSKSTAFSAPGATVHINMVPANQGPSPNLVATPVVPQGGSSVILSPMRNFEVPHQIQLGTLQYVEKNVWATYTWNPPSGKVWYIISSYSNGTTDDVQINNVSILNATLSDEYTMNLLYYDTIISSSDTLKMIHGVGSHYNRIWYIELNTDSTITPIVSLGLTNTNTYTVPSNTFFVIRRLTTAAASDLYANGKQFFCLATTKYWRDISIICQPGTILRSGDANTIYLWGYLIQSS